jgi:hypothetical protein
VAITEVILMALYVKGTNTEIVGTLETILGLAYASDINDIGHPIYDGETKVYWDSQKSVLKEGERIWLDEAGTEYLQSQIERRPR